MTHVFDLTEEEAVLVGNSSPTVPAVAPASIRERMQAEIDSLRHQLKTMEHSKSRVESANSNFLKSNMNLEDEKAKLERVNEKRKQDVRELRADCSIACQQYLRAADKVVEKDMEIHGLKSILEEKDAEIQRLKEALENSQERERNEGASAQPQMRSRKRRSMPEVAEPRTSQRLHEPLGRVEGETMGKRSARNLQKQVSYK